MRLSARRSPHGPGLILLALAAGPVGPRVVHAQDATFTGRVTGTDQAPVVGALVSVGARFTATTGTGGSYTLTIPATALTGGTVQLMVRRIGFRAASRVVPLEPGTRQEDFVLEADPLRLEDVVVTGVSDAMSTLKLPFSVGVVASAEMQQAPGVTALEAMAGKVAGVNMLQASGVPGAPPEIRVRGYTSIYTTPQPPLLIIDGTITRMTLSDISGEDIERLEVLKGAAATSYYGSDAANGVIQVFTRRGSAAEAGKAVSTARFEAGTRFVSKRQPLSMHHFYQLDANGDFLRDANGDRIPEDDLIEDNPYPVYYDHFDQVFRHGGFYTASMSVSQRTGGTSYAVSVQHTADEGPIVLQGGFQRQNYRINLDQALTPRLDLSLNLFYGRSRSDGQENAGLQASWDLMYLEPHLDITAPNPDGTPYIASLPDRANLRVYNPLYDLNNTFSTNERQRFTGGARARWRTADWLTLEGQFNYDTEASQRLDYTVFGYITPNGTPYPGDLNRGTLEGRNYNTGLTATGNWAWGSVKNTTRLAFVYEDQLRTELKTKAGAMIIGGVPHYAGADLSTLIAQSGIYAVKAQNLFAVTTFDIRDRYILDGLVRQDGSSLFGEQSRYSTYFRVSGAWRVTEDVRIPGLDELRFRASYGTAGLRPGFDYQYETLAATGGGTFVKRTLGNPLLKPAHSGEFEAGANLAFGGNRHSLEYSFSRKETRDQIVEQNLPAVSGFATQWVNAGTLLTKTHELSLGLQPVQQRRLGLTLSLTADRTRSVITKWPLPDQYAYWGWYRTGEELGLIGESRFAHTIDELYHDPAKKALSGPGQYWSRDSVLVNELGDVVRRSAWRTLEEKPILYVTCTDPPACTKTTSIVPLGRLDPDFTLSLNSSFNWKRLSLTAVLYWWQGGQIMNFDRAMAAWGGRDVIQDMAARPLEQRKPVSYFEDYASLAYEPWLESGTFVKVRELALGYTFVRSELRRVGLGLLSELRLGLVGRNLFTFTQFTGWDPEVGGSITGDFGARTSTEDSFRARGQYLRYPNPRTITAVVEIGF